MEQTHENKLDMKLIAIEKQVSKEYDNQSQGSGDTNDPEVTELKKQQKELE